MLREIDVTDTVHRNDWIVHCLEDIFASNAIGQCIAWNRVNVCTPFTEWLFMSLTKAERTKWIISLLKSKHKLNRTENKNQLFFITCSSQIAVCTRTVLSLIKLMLTINCSWNKSRSKRMMMNRYRYCFHHFYALIQTGHVLIEAATHCLNHCSLSEFVFESLWQ